MRNPFSLADLAIVLAVAVVAAVGYKFSPLLLAKGDITVQAPTDCDLNRGACKVALPDGGMVELGFSAHPVPVMKSFDIEAVISGIDAEAVDIDFAGADMNMGYNRKPLTANANEPGEFVGNAFIPVCATGRMRWQATLLIQTNGQRIAVPFIFEAPLAPAAETAS